MIERVAIVGAGTMGAGIAQLCAQSGLSVAVHDPIPAALAALTGRLSAALASAVSKGKLTRADAARALERVRTAPALDDLAGSQFVIEAAPEDLALKQELFARLSRALPEAILATNTSSLAVRDALARVESPERALGLHFFNPPAAMRLVELVRAPATGESAFALARSFAQDALGRVPVEVADTPGFIVNRVMRPYYVRAQALLGPSAGVHAVDAACRELGGVPMGPFELMDLIGLDVNLAITRSIYEALGRPERFTPPTLQAELVARGALGRKSGRGFYLYDAGRKVGENPQARPPRPGAASPAQAWRQLRDALAEEADRLVAEGGATPESVDRAITLAMNFPRGPFQWRREGASA